jgi:hypothetical protein
MRMALVSSVLVDLGHDLIERHFAIIGRARRDFRESGEPQPFEDKRITFDEEG